MKRLIKLGIASIILAGVSLGTAAHEGATGVVLERMMVMESMSKSMKTLARMFQGGDDYDAVKVQALAGGISKHGGDNLLKMYPAGNQDKGSLALPAVWEDWRDFQTLANQLKRQAGVLVEASSDQEKSLPEFYRLAETCKACHQKFKKPK